MSDLKLTEEEKRQVDEWADSYEEWLKTDEAKELREKNRQEMYQKRLERREQRKEMFRRCPSLGPFFHRPLKKF